MKDYMVTITKIEDIERNKKRVKIYIDNYFYSNILKDLVESNNIELSKSISKNVLDKIMIESELDFAYDKLLNYITKSMKTFYECKNYLYDKGFNKIIINNVLDKIKTYGYIDDKKYAEMYIDYHNENKGQKRLEMELKNKGIDENIIKETLESKRDKNSDYINALEIALKYKKQNKLDLKTREKLIRALYSKGYEWDIIQEVLRKIGIEENDDL
jgi:regulatory protein